VKLDKRASYNEIAVLEKQCIESKENQSRIKSVQIFSSSDFCPAYAPAALPDANFEAEGQNQHPENPLTIFFDLVLIECQLIQQF